MDEFKDIDLYWDPSEPPILGPPELSCDPGMKLIRLADGGQVCVPINTRPPEQLCGPGQIAVEIARDQWVCKPIETPPIVITPPPTTGGTPTTTGGGTPVPGTDPLETEPAGIVATLFGEDGTNIFGIKPIYAIGAAVVAFFALGGNKK